MSEIASQSITIDACLFAGVLLEREGGCCASTPCGGPPRQRVDADAHRPCGHVVANLETAG